MARRLRGRRWFWQRGLRPRSNGRRRDGREGERKRRERSRCLERGNLLGWPATLISVGSFALPKRSNRGEAAFNHSIADASDPSSCHGAARSRYPGYGRIRVGGAHGLAVCLSFWRLDVAENKRWINSRRFATEDRDIPGISEIIVSTDLYRVS